MANVRAKGILERGAASDLWRNTLSQITSTYGRLVYLSSLRKPNSGKYEHHGLALLYGESEADKAVRKSHVEAFEIWLNFSLAQQQEDLSAYLASLHGERRSIIQTWSRLTPYRSVAPASARQAEKDLYCADFEALLELMKNEYAITDPEA
jgi:hypothetical protein